MAKLGERFFEQDGSVIHQEVHDFTDVLNRAQQLRSAGLTHTAGNKDMQLLGSIPSFKLKEWAKEESIPLTNREEIGNMLRRKLLSGDFDKLCVAPRKRRGLS